MKLRFIVGYNFFITLFVNFFKTKNKSYMKGGWARIVNEQNDFICEQYNPIFKEIAAKKYIREIKKL